MPKIIKGFEHIPYKVEAIEETEVLERTKLYYQHLDQRRSIRTFSDKAVPKEVIENLILAASTAPSGAHKQPWNFCAISNPALKSKIREAAEAEERESYESRMSDRWKKDLEPIATDANKPFLEVAPWLVVAFKKIYDLDESGNKQTNYYVNESVGIACGMFITAVHKAGLVTLTHTPSPMNFLSKILERPVNEKAYILFPVGYPSEEVFVPNLKRKSLDKVSCFYE